MLQGPLLSTFFCILHFGSCIDMYKAEELVPVFKNDVIIYACGSLSVFNLKYSQGQVLYCSHSGDWKHFSQVKASD